MAKLIGYIGENVGIIDDWQEQEDAQLATYREQFRAENTGDTVGEVIRWQRADGYACYMVVSEEPLKLAHINHGDSYQVEDALIRGLIMEDVIQMVGRERAMSKLFGKAS